MDRPAGAQSPTSSSKQQHHQRPNPANPNRKRGTPLHTGQMCTGTHQWGSGGCQVFASRVRLRSPAHVSLTVKCLERLQCAKIGATMPHHGPVA